MPPLPHPLMSNWNHIEDFKNRRENGGGALSKRDEDQESEICSVIIPPLLAPIQSHAILEKSLGHEIPPIQPRGTPATHKRSTLKFGGNNNGGPHSAPTLPTRTHSKLTMKQHTVRLFDIFYREANSFFYEFAIPIYVTLNFCL